MLNFGGVYLPTFTNIGKYTIHGSYGFHHPLITWCPRQARQAMQSMLARQASPRSRQATGEWPTREVGPKNRFRFLHQTHDDGSMEKDLLGGGFNYFLFSPLFGEDSNFD